MKINSNLEIRVDDRGVVDEIVGNDINIHWECLSKNSAMLRIGSLLLTVYSSRRKLHICGSDENGSWEGGEFSK